MKRFLIPAILMFILLTAFGCGNSDNILAPGSDTGNDVTLSSNYEADVWSEVAFLAAPKKDKNKDKDKDNDNDNDNGNGNGNSRREYKAEKVIGKGGGQLKIKDKSAKDKTKLNFPQNALKENKAISMTVTTDEESGVEFEFGPHETYFDEPVELKLSWRSLLEDLRREDLILYYYNDGEWQEETRGEWNDSQKIVTLIINHFSRYSYVRR